MVARMRTVSESVDVLVIGPGAMGCLHAALLSEAGVRTGLLDHRPDRAERINEGGIIVEYDDEQRTVPVRCSADAEDFAPTRLALLLVKAYDTEEATQHALPALGDEGGMVGFTAGGATPLYLASQSEYRPTEYIHAWAGFWFDEDRRLEAG